MSSPVHGVHRFHSQLSPVHAHYSFCLVGYRAVAGLSGGPDVLFAFPLSSLNIMNRLLGRLLQTFPAPRRARALVQITWAGVIW